MKRPLAVVLVLVVALVLVPLALAGNGSGGGSGTGDGSGGHGCANGKAKFQLNGTIVSVDGEAGSLVVLVRTGSKTVKSFRGLEMPLVVDPAARIKDGPASMDSDEAVLLTISQLVAGARVHIGGRIDRTDPLKPVFVARKIIVQSWPEVMPPEPTPEPSQSPSVEPSDEPTTEPTYTD